MEFLREWRRKKGLTQADLAARIGVSQAAICQWETGATTPSPLMIGQLSEVLGIPLAMLLSDMEMNRWSRVLERSDLDNQRTKGKERR
jgi:transcriptional regulator with XRE-family HTH domain